MYDSAEFVQKNFPQPTDFRSHEGLVPFTVFRKKTQLTSTHPSYLSMSGLTLDIVQEKLLRRGDHNLE